MVLRYCCVVELDIRSYLFSLHAGLTIPGEKITQHPLISTCYVVVCSEAYMKMHSRLDFLFIWRNKYAVVHMMLRKLHDILFSL